MENTTGKKSGTERTYVIVSLGGENYAINVMQVNIINGLTEIRPVPNSMPYMKGIITLRETIVPVIDMRIKFNLEAAPYTKTTVIVIVNIHDRLIGLLVDSVLDVTDLHESKVQDTPHFSANINADCISGVSEINGKLVVLLDTDKIITRKELENIADNDSINDTKEN
ncbi:MAG: purine-binding chemotaxis protein CheW [Spirochaetes bacterium]|nr:purine-binding chemotaxis protein CheW [Spirochaetota bacterium]